MYLLPNYIKRSLPQYVHSFNGLNIHTMTHSTQTTGSQIVAFTLFVAVLGVTLFSTPLFASAESYAYVDATGEVRSVTANDWMTAIATAPNIHINSGVFTLKTAADYAVVGEDIPGAN